MADNSAIEWTDATWNPVTGCTKVSPGCDHCYAETFAERWRGVKGHPFESGFDLQLRPDRLQTPLSWKRPRRIFVNSMSDLFHRDVPDYFVAQVFDTMARAYWHTFQVLTKRPERMRRLLRRWPWCEAPNVWLGVSVESVGFAWRVDMLRETPAAVRFLSIEPMLGPVRGLAFNNIDWVIVGGESGPGARPMNPAWAIDVRDQCTAAGVAFFFKQWGGRSPKAGGRLLEGREWSQYPASGRAASLVRA